MQPDDASSRLRHGEANPRSSDEESVRTPPATDDNRIHALESALAAVLRRVEKTGGYATPEEQDVVRAARAVLAGNAENRSSGPGGEFNPSGTQNAAARPASAPSGLAIAARAWSAAAAELARCDAEVAAIAFRAGAELDRMDRGETSGQGKQILAEQRAALERRVGAAEAERLALEALKAAAKDAPDRDTLLEAARDWAAKEADLRRGYEGLAAEREALDELLMVARRLVTTDGER